MTIRNPVEWSADALSDAARSLGDVAHAMNRPAAEYDTRPLSIRRIDRHDLRDALREGFDDFVALRTDVLSIGLIYPLAGLVLAQFALHAEMLPIVFPLVAGFALLGPFAALGLYEASRRRERGEPARWSNVIDAFASPSAGAILTLGLVLAAIFALWLCVAWAISLATLGSGAWTSPAGFLHAVVATPAGWAMTLIGCSVGAVFAVLVLAIAVVSFPLLLDRRVSVMTAVETSFAAVRANPETMLLWGMIVAGSLAIGALPALLGLIVVVPVLGHATWRLYRKVVA